MRWNSRHRQRAEKADSSNTQVAGEAVGPGAHPAPGPDVGAGQRRVGVDGVEQVVAERADAVHAERTVDNAILEPKPVRRPRPTTYAGGESEAVRTLIAACVRASSAHQSTCWNRCWRSRTPASTCCFSSAVRNSKRWSGSAVRSLRRTAHSPGSSRQRHRPACRAACPRACGDGDVADRSRRPVTPALREPAMPVTTSDSSRASADMPTATRYRVRFYRPPGGAVACGSGLRGSSCSRLAV